jgi:hypothetical protein
MTYEKIAVFDLEFCVDGRTELLWGYRDEGGYVSFEKIDGLLGHVLSPGLSGYTFFTHGGGQFEFPAIAAWLSSGERSGYEMSGSYNGMSLDRMRLTSGDLSWDFCDCYPFLLKSLRALSRELGEEDGRPGGIDRVWAKRMTPAQLRHLNEIASYVLFRSLQALSANAMANLKYGLFAAPKPVQLWPRGSRGDLGGER